MLELAHSTLGYPKRKLFRSADASVRPGEVTGLIAPNGRGKTTLMRSLVGVDALRYQGELTVDGTVVRPGSGTCGKVLYAAGNGSLLDGGLTARDHLTCARAVWASPRTVEDIAGELAVDTFMEQHVRLLSDGMRQLVTIAVASMTTAPYLLLDEPTNALDPGMSHRVIAAVRRMAQEGRGILVSSRILADLDEMCDRLLAIRDCKIVQVPFRCESGGCAAAYRACYGRGGAWER